MKFLSRSINSIATAGWILSFSALISALLGLLRTRLLLDLYGVAIQTDIYNVAFRVPDLIYTLTLSGAISAALVPILISHYSNKKEEAWKIAQSFFFVALLFVSVLSIILFILMPYAVDVLAPGFDADAKSQAVLLSRIMLASPILLGISAVFSGILQSTRKFVIYALAPLFYNAGIIVGILFFTDIWGLKGLAYGVVLGALLHASIQIPAVLSTGFRFRRGRKLFHAQIGKIAKLIAPRSFASSIHQVNLIVITALASIISTGSITIFMNSYNINMLLTGILGISFATALFPALSKSIVNKNYKQYLSSFASTFGGVLFLVIPASVLFIILRTHIVQIAYGVSDVSWDQTQLMAISLGVLSIGGFAYTLLPIVARTFYAKQNTFTPVIASIVGVVSNIVISATLIYLVFPSTNVLQKIQDILQISNIESADIIALPIAFSIAGILSLLVALGMFFVSDARNISLVPQILGSFARILSLSVVSGCVGWLALSAFDSNFQNNSFVDTMIQSVLVLGSMGVIYLCVSYLLKFPEMRILKTFTSRFNGT